MVLSVGLLAKRSPRNTYRADSAFTKGSGGFAPHVTDVLVTETKGPDRRASTPPWFLWGAALSPYALKVEAMLRFKGVPFVWRPRTGGFFDALRLQARRRRLVAGGIALTAPEPNPLDEFPLVPFLFGPDGENLYDSSAIGAWLDSPGPAALGAGKLVPQDDPGLAFAIRLVDEAIDEVGLYLVHHNRWVVSARDNGAGARLADEMRPLYGPLAPIVRRFFPVRQCRRLPYLFSVAAPDDPSFADLPARLRPPARAGFPGTHRLLDEMYERLLEAVEPILARRPFLFGDAFTLADASLYGQIGMNIDDVSARVRLGQRAPATESWVLRIAAGNFRGHRPGAELVVDEALGPLFVWIGRTFVPLMQQNHDAYERHRAAGETLFNESGFNRGRALYDGELLGRPFRHVAKTFQVRVWRSLLDAWAALPGGSRAALPLDWDEGK